MMRYDKLYWYDHGSYTEMTAPSSNINVTDEDESKEIIVHKNLWENNSKDVSESERNIVNGTLSAHVHRQKQIFLTCELSQTERLPSGATMIN